jgi:hypothetical protein
VSELTHLVDEGSMRPVSAPLRSVILGPGAQSWPKGSGDPQEDIRASCRRSIEKWGGVDVISPELRRKEKERW